MTDKRVARMDDEDESLPVIDGINYVRVVTQKHPSIVDPFAQAGDELKEIRNTSSNFKRKVTNEIKKFHRGTDHQAGSKRIEDHDVVNGYDLFGVVTPPHDLEGLSQIYELSTAHYAAINAKTANIVGLGYKLVETPKTKRALEQVTDEARAKRVRQRSDLAREQLNELIEGLNEEQTLTEVLINVWIDYEATGNGYIEIGRRRDGSIGYVGHIPSKTMRVRKDRDGFVQLSSNRAQFFLNFGDTETANPINSERPNEVIHLLRYSPAGGTYYGVPDIVAAQQAVAGNEFAARFNLEFFENKAVPRHLITLKGANMSGNAQSELLTFFETGLKGQNHRSLFVPLPADDGNNKVEFKIEAIDAKVQESSFVNYRKGNMNEILMAHRVPVSKVSTADGASLAIARDADKTFKEQVCQPQQRILEKKLNRIIKEFSDAFELRLNEMTLTDADTQSKIDERMVKAGIWLPNEPRLRDGMPAIQGGDERVDLNAKDKIAQAQAEATTTRERDAARSAGSSDTSGEARQPKGDGRATA